MEWYISAGGLQNQPMYHCDVVNRTKEEWFARGKSDTLLGYAFLVYGIIVEIIYVPCLTVIMRPQYLKLSCYKIMTVLGTIDMLAILVNSVLTGYLMLQGAVYCTHPHLIYIAGALGLGLWCSACMSCLVLVCNRLIDLWKPHLMDGMFGGNRTFYVMVFPIIYGIYFIFFTEPLLFNSTHNAWFFDPFIFDSKEEEMNLTGSTFFYANVPHTINNLLIVVVTCLLYTTLCYVLANKFKNDYNAHMSWTQKSIFIQSTLICMANLVASLVYVYMQFFPTPDAFILAGHIGWQFGHGFPAIVYLCLNRTIQREVLKMIGIDRVRLHSIGKTVPFKSTVLPDSSANRQSIHI